MSHVFVGLGILRFHIGLCHPALQSWTPGAGTHDAHGLPVGVGHNPAARVRRAVQKQPHAAELGTLGQLEKEFLPTKHQVTTSEGHGRTRLGLGGGHLLVS